MPARMTTDAMHAYLDSKPGWAILSTLDPDGIPHTVALGYYRLGDELVMGVRDATNKVANIERDGRVSVLVESGSTMADLKGVMLQGHATVHRAADEVLHYAREGAKLRGVSEAELPTQATPGAVYIRVTPERVRSWDYGAAS
ncbi:MAG: pyridoxamine 5'-phosphate oxidase family protein [Myxococcota bacterium]